MNGTMIITYRDGKDRHVILDEVQFIKILVGNQDYRIKILDEGDGIQLAVDAQLVVLPQASNLVFLKGEHHGPKTE